MENPQVSDSEVKQATAPVVTPAPKARKPRKTNKARKAKPAAKPVEDTVTVDGNTTTAGKLIEAVLVYTWRKGTELGLKHVEKQAKDYDIPPVASAASYILSLMKDKK